MKPQWYTACLSRIQDVTPRHKRFWFQLQDTDHFDFLPGQFITLELPIDERRPKRWRHYSIASPPNGNEIEIVVVRVPGGKGTTFLFEQAQVGDCFPLRGPQGKFVLPDDLTERPICMIATGTGIAPFRSMLWHIYRKQLPYHSLYLVFGARNRQELLYHDEFQQLQQNLERFEYHPVLSREQWEGHTGYVHDVYTRLFADHRPAYFYLCGLRNMIDEARQRLQQMGYDKSDIKYEAYD